MQAVSKADQKSIFVSNRANINSITFIFDYNKDEQCYCCVMATIPFYIYAIEKQHLKKKKLRKYGGVNNIIQ